MSLCRDMMPPWEMKAEIDRLAAEVEKWQEVARMSEKRVAFQAEQNARLAARVAELEGALQAIDERHIPDQPSALDIPEEDYLRRQYAELRRIARAALTKGSGKLPRTDSRYNNAERIFGDA